MSNRVASCQSTHATQKVSRDSHCNVAIWIYLDHVALPLMSFQARDRREHVFNVAMSPVFAFNL